MIDIKMYYNGKGVWLQVPDDWDLKRMRGAFNLGRDALLRDVEIAQLRVDFAKQGIDYDKIVAINQAGHERLAGSTPEEIQEGAFRFAPLPSEVVSA